MSRSELMAPLARAREIIRRARIPRPSTIVEVFEGCRSWDEVIAVAEVLRSVLPVSVHDGTIAVMVSVKRHGNDIKITKVVARRRGEGFSVAVVSHYI